MATTNKAFKVKNGLSVGGMDGTVLTTTNASGGRNAVFVYDTSKDSDGGAWRFRTQHTSWYQEDLNTANRGSRRQFPAIAIIVCHTDDKIRIYDGDDPTHPLWMRFNIGYSNYEQGSPMIGNTVGGTDTNNRPQGVVAKNGQMWFIKKGEYGGNTTYNAVSWIDFIADQGGAIGTAAGNGIPGTNDHRSIIYPLPISGRDTAANDHSINDRYADGSKSGDMTDLDICVLPNAPINPMSGLPYPTVAISSVDYGISVFTDKGSVEGITISNGCTAVRLDPKEGLIGYSTNLSYAPGDDYYIRQIPDHKDVAYNASGYNYRYSDYVTTPPISWRPHGANAGFSRDFHFLPDRFVGMNYNDTGGNFNPAITWLTREPQQSEQMVAYTDHYGCTGWQPAITQAALINDNDDTTLSVDNLVTNGNFDSDVSNWSTTYNATVAHSTNKAVVTMTANGIGGIIQTVTGLTVGKAYRIEASVTNNHTSSMDIRLQISGKGLKETTGQHVLTGNKVLFDTFVATSTFQSIEILAYGGVNTATFDVDSVKFQEAARDKSAKALAWKPMGAITRGAVATGADLKYMLLQSAGSHYLEWDTDFAPAFSTNWTFMTWVKRDELNTWDMILSRSGPSATHGDGIGWRSIGGGISVQANGTNVVDSSNLGKTSVQNQEWQHICVTCRAEEGIRFYYDGKLAHRSNTTVNFTLPDSTYYWALGAEAETSYSSSPIDGRRKYMALVKFGTTHITEDQVKRIYKDERPMFNENAKIATSQLINVSGAYDPDTNLFHMAAGNSGIDTFDGFIRVKNTDQDAGLSISASNGLVVAE